MLQITASLTASRLTANPTAGLGLTLTVADTDPYITQVSSTVDWGDGTSAASGTVAAPYGPVTLVHVYSPGTYLVRVTAQNFKAPAAQTALFQQQVTVVAAGAITTTASPVLFGPILPRSQGAPSRDTWNFNLARDGTVLESSLLMLFHTTCGERVYDRDYGSNLRRLVFSLDDETLGTAVREEMARAVARHEPRVELMASSFSRDRSARSVQINAEFRSRLSQQPIVLNLAFAA